MGRVIFAVVLIIAVGVMIIMISDSERTSFPMTSKNCLGDSTDIHDKSMPWSQQDASFYQYTPSVIDHRDWPCPPVGMTAVKTINHVMYIHGDISPEIISQFIGLQRLDRVVLNTQGGDIATGLEIINQIRLRNAELVIPSGGSCFSMCVFMMGILENTWSAPNATFLAHNTNYGINGERLRQAYAEQNGEEATAIWWDKIATASYAKTMILIDLMISMGGTSERFKEDFRNQIGPGDFDTNMIFDTYEARRYGIVKKMIMWETRDRFTQSSLIPYGGSRPDQ